MYITRINNIEHAFSLAGMKVGDWFMGCEKCWQQYPPNAAGPGRCRICGAPMLIYDLGPHNAAEISAASSQPNDTVVAVKMKTLIVHDGDRRILVTLHKLDHHPTVESQAMLSVQEPVLADPRWGSVCKYRNGRIEKWELNELCRISDELLDRVSKIFRMNTENPEPTETQPK